MRKISIDAAEPPHGNHLGPDEVVSYDDERARPALSCEEDEGFGHVGEESKDAHEQNIGKSILEFLIQGAQVAQDVVVNWVVAIVGVSLFYRGDHEDQAVGDVRGGRVEVDQGPIKDGLQPGVVDHLGAGHLDDQPDALPDVYPVDDVERLVVLLVPEDLGSETAEKQGAGN